jgi:hypothetical protein
MADSNPNNPAPPFVAPQWPDPVLQARSRLFEIGGGIVSPPPLTLRSDATERHEGAAMRAEAGSFNVVSTTGGAIETLAGVATEPATVQYTSDGTVQLEARTQVGISGSAAITLDPLTVKAEATVVPFPVSVGKTVLINRDTILLQSTSIQSLLADFIERQKSERANSTSLPELEAILVAFNGLHQLLLTATVPAEALGEKALSVRTGLANWWRQDHVSILSRSFDFGIFASVVGICVLAGVIPAAIGALIVRPKESAELFKEINKALENLDRSKGT